MTGPGGMRAAANFAQGISNTVQGTGAILSRLAGGSWWDQLRPASYRGVPFAVLGGTARFGRRNAIHQYPNRDTVWVEDLGRAARRIGMTAFLVGDDAIAQRERLIGACEMPGDGELIHPTLGRLRVSLLEISSEERWDQGRVFSLSLSFVEGGKRVFPNAAISTGDGVASAADAADGAANADFATRALAALNEGAAVAGEATATAAAWTAKAARIGNDASNLYFLVGSLPGSYGRYAGNRNGIASTSALPAPGISVQSLLANGTILRSAVGAASTNLSSMASGLGL